MSQNIGSGRLLGNLEQGWGGQPPNCPVNLFQPTQALTVLGGIKRRSVTHGSFQMLSLKAPECLTLKHGKSAGQRDQSERLQDRCRA